MKKLCIALSVFMMVACTRSKKQKSVQRIAFGSCAHQAQSQPILELAAAQKTEAFIYLGDNIYSDTYSMDTLRMNYEILFSKPEFKKLKEATRILAVWDDHDYGWNDSGRHYPFKRESKEIFLNFFGNQGDSSIYNHDGIYHTVYLGEPGSRVQIIFPDTRTFRDKLLTYNGNRDGEEGYNYSLDYSPYTTPDSTMLGELQWQWLEEQLKQPAELRIIATSTQFSITHNGYEAWANLPHEQQRFIDLIKKTKANGVIFISGDVHYAELSKLQQDSVYSLYDLTSSGITSTWDFATPNDNRIAGPVMENNFGLICINWRQDDPEINLAIYDKTNKQRIDHTIKLSELKF